MSINTKTFVLDTVTSGFAGMTMYHKNTRLLQLACLDVETGDTFNEYCDPEFTELEQIPEESFAIHKLDIQTLKDAESKPAAEVVLDFKNWIYARCEAKHTAIIVAYNARYDKDMILRAFPKGHDPGIDGVDLNWVFFDILAAFKGIYPELVNEIYMSDEKPYMLANLQKHFFTGTHLRGNDAQSNVECTARLYQEVIQKKETVDINKQYIIENIPMTLTKKLIDQGPELYNPKVFKLKNIVAKLNDGFKKSRYEKYTTTNEICTLGHLMLYAEHRYETYEKVYTYKEKKEIDAIFTCREIELLLRKCGLHDDSDLLKIIAAAHHSTPLEILNHSTPYRMIEKGYNIFPSSPKSPISYLPWIITADEASKMFNILGYMSYSDVCGKYACSKNKEDFIIDIQTQAIPNLDAKYLKTKYRTY